MPRPGERLLPVRLQNVTPPEPFDKRQSFDLTNWEGAISAPRFQKFVEVLSNALGRDTIIESDTFEDLESLASFCLESGETGSRSGFQGGLRTQVSANAAADGVTCGQFRRIGKSAENTSPTQ
jgi:hypothetical protein